MKLRRFAIAKMLKAKYDSCHNIRLYTLVVVVDVLVVVVLVLLVAVKPEHRVSWYCVTPGAPYCCSRFLASVWIQQPAELSPLPSQSTATQLGLLTQAVRQSSTVVMVVSRDAPTELVSLKDLHGTQSPVTVDVVATFNYSHNVNVNVNPFKGTDVNWLQLAIQI